MHQNTLSLLFWEHLSLNFKPQLKSKHHCSDLLSFVENDLRFFFFFGPWTQIVRDTGIRIDYKDSEQHCVAFSSKIH